MSYYSLHLPKQPFYTLCEFVKVTGFMPPNQYNIKLLEKEERGPGLPSDFKFKIGCYGILKTFEEIFYKMQTEEGLEVLPHGRGKIEFKDLEDGSPLQTYRVQGKDQKILWEVFQYLPKSIQMPSGEEMNFTFYSPYAEKIRKYLE